MDSAASCSTGKEKGATMQISERKAADVSISETTNGEQQIAQKETAALRRTKLFMFAVLILSALAVGLCVYSFIRTSEQSEFETQFHDLAEKCLDAVGRSLYQTLGAVDGLLFNCAAYARSSPTDNWPFVTVPDFGIRAAKVLSLSDGLFLALYPFVESAQRATWENYTATHKQWLEPTFALQEFERFDHVAKVPAYQTWDVIHYYDEYVKGEAAGINGTSAEGPYLPMWQSFPVVPKFPPYNWDLLQTVEFGTVQHTLAKKDKTIVSAAFLLPDLSVPSEVQTAEFTRDWIQDFLRPGEEPMEPVSNIYYPIIDSAEWDQLGSPDAFVGILSMIFYWRDLIKEILPPGANGIVVVFENECNPSFTYQINGPKVVYLGRGDLHDPSFSLVRSSKLVDLNSFNHRGQAYTGLPVDETFCPTILNVYPSKTLFEAHHSANRVTFTIVAIMIFIFTSAVFITYDYCVERRQRVVMYTALTSAMNVSSLEEKVAERTSSLQAANRNLEAANRRVLDASAAQLQHFACMSHEIRTPLNCIIGCAGLLRDTSADPVQRDYVQMINAAGDLLLAVVNDVLDYSQLESGNVDIELKRTSLQQVLDSVIRTMDAKAQEHKISLRTEYDVALPEHFETDSRRFQQIMYNLLGNAVKFSSEKSSIELKVSVDFLNTPADNIAYSPPRKTELSDKTALCFVVKDYGKGIAKSDFKKIFQPFRQDSSETGDLYGGSGLGLSITTKLVHRMGGSISIKSEVGKWTEVTVRLPAHAEPKPDVVAHMRQFEIYLVCEDAEIREHVSRICRFFGIALTCFLSFQEVPSEGTTKSKATFCVFLVQAKTYNKTAYNSFVASSSNTALVTFGPDFMAEEANAHFRNLSQVIPCHLVKSINAVVATVTGKQSTRDPVQTPTVPYKELRILIAEDNIVNQKVLKRMLQRLGVQKITIVDNGQKAVDQESKEIFDVVLMDVQMPVMDGIEACRLIQERSRSWRKPTMVFVTAHALDTYEEKCFAVGADDFLTKPCNMATVDECFRRILAKPEEPMKASLSP